MDQNLANTVRSGGDPWVRALLAAIAILLGVLAARPFFAPDPAYAQREHPDYYIEPGYTLLRQPGGMRQVYGKVVVDLKTGDIWGFPTGFESPYPYDPTKDAPPVSSPIRLGRFDFAQLQR